MHKPTLYSSSTDRRPLVPSPDRAKAAVWNAVCYKNNVSFRVHANKTLFRLEIRPMDPTPSGLADGIDKSCDFEID